MHFVKGNEDYRFYFTIHSKRSHFCKSILQLPILNSFTEAPNNKKFHLCFLVMQLIAKQTLLSCLCVFHAKATGKTCL